MTVHKVQGSEYDHVMLYVVVLVLVVVVVAAAAVKAGVNQRPAFSLWVHVSLA